MAPPTANSTTRPTANSTTPNDVRETVEEAAERVYAELGGGHLESVYRQATAIEFREVGIDYEVEHTREIFYKEQRVGEHRLDFLVLVLDDDDVVIELKAKDSAGKPDRAQLGSYLRTLSKKTGMKQSGMAGVSFKLISAEEQWEIFDDAARRLLDIDGLEFARRWDDGDFLNRDEPGVMQVAILRPHGWPHSR